MAEGTIPQPTLAELPVRSVAAEITDGPDRGAREERPETLAIGTAESNDLVLTDPHASRFHAEFTAVPGGIRIVDHGSTNGTWVGNVSVEQAVVRPGTLVRLGETWVRLAAGAGAVVPLHDEDRLGELRGRSPAMRRLMARLRKVAAAQVPVVLLGESGTGKELAARALHEEGDRAGGPFVTVDCGAVTPTLIASELFGHERGAFTGATRDHSGAFERAHRGTLFLDEVGELPADLQVSLLGVLERRRLRRVGGKKELSVDVRVVAATNRDLREAVNRGTFRLDLYHRLAVVVVHLPPLREHVEDIPLLVDHFLAQAGSPRRASDLFTAAELEALERHGWPGNVRELRNVVDATLALGEPTLPEPDGSAGSAPSTDSPLGPLLNLPYGQARERLLTKFEARYLPHLLERARGNLSEASRLARMDRSYLRQLLRKHGLR